MKWNGMNEKGHVKVTCCVSLPAMAAEKRQFREWCCVFSHALTASFIIPPPPPPPPPSSSSSSSSYSYSYSSPPPGLHDWLPVNGTITSAPATTDFINFSLLFCLSLLLILLILVLVFGSCSQFPLIYSFSTIHFSFCLGEFAFQTDRY